MGNNRKLTTYKDVLNMLDLLDEHAPNWVADIRGYVTHERISSTEFKKVLGDFYKKMSYILDNHIEKDVRGEGLNFFDIIIAQRKKDKGRIDTMVELFDPHRLLNL